MPGSTKSSRIRLGLAARAETTSASSSSPRAAQSLIDEFLVWARTKECVEAHVDSYAANVGVQALYERNGFTVQSISRVHRLWHRHDVTPQRGFEK